jgi:hypothetical protein
MTKEPLDPMSRERCAQLVGSLQATRSGVGDPSAQETRKAVLVHSVFAMDWC